MRPTTVLSFLAVSMAVLSPVYTAPVPTEVDSAGSKRWCTYTWCRIAETPSSDGDGSVLMLVNALIETLTIFKDNISPTNTTSTINLASSHLGPVTEIDVVEPETSA